MDNHSKKIFYKPPKVQPSKKLQIVQQPEWNSYQQDLNQYKLSNAEIVN